MRMAPDLSDWHFSGSCRFNLRHNWRLVGIWIDSLGLIRVLALEAAPHIVVTAVAPGWVNTAMGSESGPTEKDFEMGIQDNPFGRPLYPSEVADVIVYAATNISHALTGQTLHARGGSLPFM